MSAFFRRLSSKELEGALLRYRLMAWIVGSMLLFLCVVALPLQYVAHRPAVATVGFTIHGIFYIVYLIAVADLGRRARFRLPEIVGLVCAGFLPGLAFFIERRTTRRLLGDGPLTAS
ncbi:MAG: DUF3817 domain-containing protein [Acidimicrobiales bacterium]